MTKKSLGRLVLLATVALLTRAVSGEDLPRDARVVTGTLDNGVTWTYRKHANPRGRMALLLHVAAGSLNETDAQRGLAHFLQHLAFEGSESFPAGELTADLQSLGMTVGCNVNATTGFEQTTYAIYLPGTTTEQVDQALLALSDLAFRCLLPNEALDKVRPAILDERKTGTDAFRRVRDKLWPELFARSRLAERMIIGTEDVIRGATRSELLGFYRTWYRPERVTLFMVGDAEPGPFVALIQKRFGEYEPKLPARAARGAELEPFTRQRAFVVSDPEYPQCQVTMYSLRTGRPPTATVAQARAELVEEIGSRILFRRCHRRAHTDAVAFRSAVTGIARFLRQGRLVTAVARGEPEQWRKILEDLIVEITRARKHGFSREELDEVCKDYLETVERRTQTEAMQNARVILQTLSEAVAGGEPIMSPKQQAELVKRLLPTISLEQVNAAFAENFRPGAFAYVVTLPEKQGVKVPSREEVIAAARAALEKKTVPALESEP
jgi:zinc protease